MENAKFLITLNRAIDQFTRNHINQYGNYIRPTHVYLGLNEMSQFMYEGWMHLIYKNIDGHESMNYRDVEIVEVSLNDYFKVH